jgi:hypothetical protein
VHCEWDNLIPPRDADGEQISMSCVFGFNWNRVGDIHVLGHICFCRLRYCIIVVLSPRYLSYRILQVCNSLFIWNRLIQAVWRGIPPSSLRHTWTHRSCSIFSIVTLIIVSPNCCTVHMSLSLGHLQCAVMPKNFIFLGIEFFIAKRMFRATSKDRADRYCYFKYTSTRSLHSWTHDTACSSR